MKKTANIFCAAALFLFAACTTDEFNMSVPSVGGITKFNVETESATKAVFGNDLSVTWAVGDSIKIFANGVAAKFKADAAGTSSSFTIAPDQTPLADTTVYFGVASYTAGWSIAGDVITTTIPTYQTAAPGSINPKYLLMAARSTDLNLSMKNLVSLIKITLSDDNVTSVNITAKGGAKISGPTTVTLSGAGDPEIVASTPYIVLVPERNDDGTLKECFEPGDYYIAAAPAAISAGIEVVLFNKDNTDLGIKSSGSACNLYRSEVMYLDDLCSVIEWESTVTTGLKFHTGSAFVDPFAFPELSMGTSFSYDDESKFSPEGQRNVVISAVANEANGGLTYKLFSQKGYWKNSSQGFRSFPDIGDYIEFPAFEGLSLKAVKWTFGYQGYNNYPGLASSDGQFVVGGEPLRTYTQTGDFTVWTNLNTSENTAYRITPSSSGSAVACRNFTLYYIGTPTPFVVSVKTGKVSNLTGTEATIAGSFIAFASSDIASDYTCGIEYKTGSGDWTSVAAGTAAASFSVNVTGLTNGATYTYRAWAKSSTGEKVYGAETSFESTSILVKSYQFIVNSKWNNPFKQKISSSSTSLTSAGARYDVTDANDSTLEFSLFSTGGLYFNSSQGLRFSSPLTIGDYIMFPAISGKRLIKVEVENASSSGYYAPTVIKAVTNATTPTFGATLVTLANSGTTHVYDLSSTAIAAGQRCALIFNGASTKDQARIVSITLTFQ